MISLFPAYKGYIVAGSAVLFMLACMLYRQVFWLLPVLLFTIGVILVVIVVELLASLRHQKLLTVLYGMQRPVDFITLYEPLLQQEKIRPHIRFTILAYLSNGYAAAGQFSKALELLDIASTLPVRRKDSAQRLLAGNCCSIYLAKGDLIRAKEQYKLFAQHNSKTKGTKLALELSQSAKILDIRLSLFEGNCRIEDAAIIRQYLRQNGSLYYKSQLRFLLGQIYISLGELEPAKEYLTQVANAGNGLWIAGQANGLLESLFAARS